MRPGEPVLIWGGAGGLGSMAIQVALERLVRYLLRPLIEYHFRRPDPSDRTSWVPDGATWRRRLATLIPPRRSHTNRFHGVLSSAHT